MRLAFLMLMLLAAACDSRVFADTIVCTTDSDCPSDQPRCSNNTCTEERRRDDDDEGGEGEGEGEAAEGEGEGEGEPACTNCPANECALDADCAEGACKHVDCGTICAAPAALGEVCSRAVDFGPCTELDVRCADGLTCAVTTASDVETVSHCVPEAAR